MRQVGVSGMETNFCGIAAEAITEAKEYEMSATEEEDKQDEQEDAENDDEEDDGDDEDDEDVEDEEASLALLRVIKRYENAKIVDVTPEEVHEQMDRKYEEKFRGWKDKYYKGKFGWGLENNEGMRKLTENYVQGLQWVLYYYYRGVASWPWYYGYHYSPMISGLYPVYQDQ